MALVCAPRSRAGASKFSFSKNSRGLKYQYFFVKIGLKLIFTIKNRRKHTNLKLSLKTILFWPPKSMILVFEETPPQKKKKIGRKNVLKVFISKFKNVHFWGSPNFCWIFLYVLAFERIEAQMFFWIWTSKIVPDLWLLDLFCLFTYCVRTEHCTVHTHGFSSQIGLFKHMYFAISWSVGVQF